MDRTAPSPDAVGMRLKLPLGLRVAALLTLFATLAFLVLAVYVGAGGNIPLSNDLAVAALVAMALFAGVNLTQERKLSRPGTSAPSAGETDSA